MKQPGKRLLRFFFLKSALPTYLALLRCNKGSNTSIITSMRNILFFAAILLLSQTALLAQKTATWKGGTPGKPTEWNCAANWKEGHVPNEFSQVIIPDVSSSSFSNPVLTSGEVEICSLLIHTGASLRIGKNARLIATEQEEHGFLAWGEGVLQPDTLQQQLNFVNR